MPVYPLPSGERNAWRLVLELPRSAATLGTRRRKVVTFRGSRREAQRRLADLETQARAGALTASRLSVGDVFDRYLAEYAAVRLAPTTYSTHQVALAVHAQLAGLRAVRVSALAPHHLAAFERYLRVEATTRRGGRPTTQRLSPVSVARYCAPVKSALDWATSVELLGRNPAQYWRVPTDRSEERPALSREHAAAFLAAVERSPWRAHLLVLLTTGLRLSELRGLRWQDVDLATGTYQVVQQWQRVNVPKVFQKPFHTREDQRTSDVRRSVPKSRAGKRGGALPGAVLAVLREWQQAQEDRQQFAGRRWRTPDGGALVFTNEHGGPFDGGTLRHALYRLLRQAGIPRLRIHDLRHSFVSLLLEASVPAHLVPQLAGHSERVDALVYRHTTAAAGKVAAEQLWTYLTPDAKREQDTGQPPTTKRGAG